MRNEIRHGHVVDIIRRELDDHELADIAAVLAQQGIRVAPVVDVYHTLHLWALAPMTTRQEVRAVAAYRNETDCRIDWHGAEAAKDQRCPKGCAPGYDCERGIYTPSEVADA
jgi:hypothetical protein